MLATSRAGLKRNVAALAPLDVSLLPYNRPLLAYLREQKAAGRKLVLATAADQRVAQAVADFLDLFDEVIASDGEHNLKGEAKATALVARFGVRGFSYAGNDSSDLAVWRAAHSAVVVNASRAVDAEVGRDMLGRCAVRRSALSPAGGTGPPCGRISGPRTCWSSCR